MKKWNIINKQQFADDSLQVEELISLLLKNRGIKTKKEQEAFLYPTLESVTPKAVGIDAKQLKKTIERIIQSIENQEQIVIFGDYDVDGITANAILWETLYALGANVLPYIPDRITEGYGLSIVGIKNIMEGSLRLPSVAQDDKKGLIITVDNGIVAHEAVRFANEQGIDVIVTDHHVAEEKLPDAFSFVHTTKLCGAGVAWVLAKELKTKNKTREIVIPAKAGIQKGNRSPIKSGMTDEDDSHLELAMLGTVADMVPLTGANRAIVKSGLTMIHKTTRHGLRSLFKQARLDKNAFTPYDVGYIIAPRLNAGGRIASAMDSLRLLCTKNKNRADELAGKLEMTNKERQQLVRDSATHALTSINHQEGRIKNILIVADESYQEGVIGLVASKLIEAFYRPSIVIAKRQKHSKASVRSIKGCDIISFLRKHQYLFVTLGGHPMAAGFTVETEKIDLLLETLEKEAETAITEDMLQKILMIDCELSLSMITKKLFTAIQALAPFGVGNYEPVFATRGVRITDLRVLGKEGSHLKLFLSQESGIKNQGEKVFEAIGFGMGELGKDLKVGDVIDIAYSVDENTWNGKTTLQLKLKDIRS